MKRIMALLMAFAMLAAAGGALAEAFTPITVDGENYLSNLDVCIASVNEIELGTNETFSFNAAVGARSEERGYRAAPNGRGVAVVGGGVGQVATTIYLAIKNLDSMEVVEKRTYGSDFCENYVPDLEDAVLTDYSQPIDFRFTNHGGAVTISVWRDDSKIYCSVEDAEAPAALLEPGTAIELSRAE